MRFLLDGIVLEHLEESCLLHSQNNKEFRDIHWQDTKGKPAKGMVEWKNLPNWVSTQKRIKTWAASNTVLQFF